MREIESTAKRSAALLVGALLVFLLAGAANAATFSVASGGSNLTWQSGESQLLPILGNTPTYGGNPDLRWRPQGYPTIMGTGSNPVSLTIAPGLISFAPSYPVQLPIPSLPSYVQFTTGLAAYAPNGGPATFKPGAKTSRPANFSWCPGAAANPACTTVLTGGAQGSISGIIKYTAGTAGPQFGGTMSVLNSGVFSWYSVVATLPTYKVKLNNGDPVTNTLVAGVGYANYALSTAGPGDKVFNDPPKVPTYYGVYSIITDPGVPASTVAGSSSIGWGMPFTTGTVYIKFPWYPSPFVTITGMGQDNRTAAGIGNISMVAGGILHGTGSGLIIGQIATLTLNVPEPSEVQMLASGVGLIGLLALVRRRVRA